MTTPTDFNQYSHKQLKQMLEGTSPESIRQLASSWKAVSKTLDEFQSNIGDKTNKLFQTWEGEAAVSFADVMNKLLKTAYEASWKADLTGIELENAASSLETAKKEMAAIPEYHPNGVVEGVTEAAKYTGILGFAADKLTDHYQEQQAEETRQKAVKVMQTLAESYDTSRQVIPDPPDYDGPAPDHHSRERRHRIGGGGGGGGDGGGGGGSVGGGSVGGGGVVDGGRFIDPHDPSHGHEPGGVVGPLGQPDVTTPTGTGPVGGPGGIGGSGGGLPGGELPGTGGGGLPGGSIGAGAIGAGAGLAGGALAGGAIKGGLAGGVLGKGGLAGGALGKGGLAGGTLPSGGIRGGVPGEPLGPARGASGSGAGLRGAAVEGPGGARGAAAGGMAGRPAAGMGPMAGARGAAGKEGKDKERRTWLVETDDVWSGDEAVAPPVLGEEPSGRGRD